MPRKRVAYLFACCIAAISCNTQLAPLETPDQPDASSRHTATRSDCNACHEREYQSAPHHAQSKRTDCAPCHTETAWTPAHLPSPTKKQTAPLAPQPARQASALKQ